MKRIIITGFLLIALFSGSVANAADFDKGFEAFNKKDYKTALRELKPLAEQGHAKSQFFLGTMYANGEGVPQDDIRSYMWYHLAALAGNGYAKEVQDWQADRLSEVAIAIVQKRAKQCVENNNYKDCFGAGIADIADLVVSYDKGMAALERGDYKTALREFKPLAEQGHMKSQFYTGAIYFGGEGVPKDDIRAYMWVNIAASTENEDAKEALDEIAEEMSADDIAIAQKRTKKCIKSNYKKC